MADNSSNGAANGNSAEPYVAFPNAFRKRLLAREPAVGCWLSLGSPVTTEIVGIAGFSNFLIPFVQNVEQAQSALAATRYPPEGVRGVSVSQRGNRYGSIPGYFDSVNQQISVTVQIENQAGVAAAE